MGFYNRSNGTYKKNNRSSSFYNSGRTESSLRDEFIDTLNGTLKEISKKQIGLLRKMRRNDSNNLIRCNCRDQVSGEPDKDTPCPLCLGEGYLFDEEYVYFYQWEPGYDSTLAQKEKITSPGLLNVPFRLFYLEYSADLSYEDKLIELSLDEDGDLIEPVRRKAIYRIGSLIDHRLDNGRIEYWRIIAFRENNVYLNLE